MTGRKNAKSKFMPEDLSEFIDQSEFTSKPSPKGKKIPKRKAETNEDDEGKDMSTTLMSQYKSAKIKRSSNLNEEAWKESKQKLLNVLKEQQESRKSSDSEILSRIEDVTCQLETESNVLKENEQKLEHFVAAIMKCLQQATISHKQKVKDLKEIYTNFKKQMQGLISKGALRADERPLWFDVYRAFPPQAEPNFGRPEPPITPIRPILYLEDNVRAMFHSEGHGLGTVNMLSPTGETHTRRLVDKYYTLQQQGTPSDQLVTATVTAVNAERQITKPIESSRNPPKPMPDSVTAQVLAEADLKNIFNDDGSDKK